MIISITIIMTVTIVIIIINIVSINVSITVIRPVSITVSITITIAIITCVTFNIRGQGYCDCKHVITMFAVRKVVRILLFEHGGGCAPPLEEQVESNSEGGRSVRRGGRCNLDPAWWASDAQRLCRTYGRWSEDL